MEYEVVPQGKCMYTTFNSSPQFKGFNINERILQTLYKQSQPSLPTSHLLPLGNAMWIHIGGEQFCCFFFVSYNSLARLDYGTTPLRHEVTEQVEAPNDTQSHCTKYKFFLTRYIQHKNPSRRHSNTSSQICRSPLRYPSSTVQNTHVFLHDTACTKIHRSDIQTLAQEYVAAPNNIPVPLYKTHVFSCTTQPIHIHLANTQTHARACAHALYIVHS